VNSDFPHPDSASPGQVTLIVTGLEELRHHRGRVTHFISILDPEDAEFLPDMGVPAGRHLPLYCHDIDSRAEANRRTKEMPGSRCIAPSPAMVRKALVFAKRLRPDDILVVCCGFGVSRSTAIAFAVMCQADPSVPEPEVFRRLLEIRPHAFPNPLIVAHADKLLGRAGRMSRAIEAAR
jgi:predicted protein tyrosine phosphatase